MVEETGVGFVEFGAEGLPEPFAFFGGGVGEGLVGGFDFVDRWFDVFDERHDGLEVVEAREHFGERGEVGDVGVGGVFDEGGEEIHGCFRVEDASDLGRFAAGHGGGWREGCGGDDCGENEAAGVFALHVWWFLMMTVD